MEIDGDGLTADIYLLVYLLNTRRPRHGAPIARRFTIMTAEEPPPPPLPSISRSPTQRLPRIECNAAVSDG
jgi:hypothetical protein